MEAENWLRAHSSTTITMDLANVLIEMIRASEVFYFGTE